MKKTRTRRRLSGTTSKKERIARKAPTSAAKGFPKELPCLVCGRPRKSTWPGDRLHKTCREQRSAAVAMEFVMRSYGPLREG